MSTFFAALFCSDKNKIGQYYVQEEINLNDGIGLRKGIKFLRGARPV